MQSMQGLQSVRTLHSGRVTPFNHLRKKQKCMHARGKHVSCSFQPPSAGPETIEWDKLLLDGFQRNEKPKEDNVPKGTDKARQKLKEVLQAAKSAGAVSDEGVLGDYISKSRQLRTSSRAKLPKEEDDWDTVWVNEEDDWDYDDEERSGKSAGGKRLPAEMRCFDTARIMVKGGDGGKGCVAFRREKFVPKGGPSGGNGGCGGNVWAVVDDSLNSLTTFRRSVHYRAKNGAPGVGSGCHGPNAEDLFVSVPPGTIIRARDAAEDDPPVAELLRAGDKALLAGGGRGGRGNAAFKSGRNNAPTLAEFGEEGIEAWLELELRLVADVGIIGVPNAGKSTLLSVVSAARPKVAAYPFTTLVPNLGVCETDFRTTVFADIPGLLEGAHAGVGLGHEFLRHCQRSRLLVHVVDGSSPDPIGDLKALELELQLFNADLASKRQIIAYNKMDLPDSSDYWDEVQEFLAERGVPSEDIFAISAATGSGVKELVRRVNAVLDTLPKEILSVTTGALNLLEVPRPKDDAAIRDFKVRMEEEGERVWLVEGDAIERFAQMTNWDYYEGANRFQKVLEAAGVNKALKKAGVVQGDTVVVGEVQLEWNDDQSEAALYDAWIADRKSKGRVAQGTARWPHIGG